MSSLTGSVLCPFTLTIEPMAAMLNFELADDPTYAGIEIQRFDDPSHGTGVAVLLMRRADRRVDVYRQPGLRLDRDSYGIGAGLGEWREAEIEPATLTVASDGVAVDVALRDVAGRRVEVRADDRDGRARRTGALLAPVGAAVERPASMLLVWMPRFDLMRTSGSPPEIRIDGRLAATGRLPGAWLHRHRLVKYAADLVVVRLNPAHSGPIAPIDGTATNMIDVVPDGDQARIGSVAVAAAGHSARLTLEPPLPDVARLADGATRNGRWRLEIDEARSVVSGTWAAQRAGERVDLELDSTAPWRPGPLPILMRIVTRIVPTFRAWPQTYRWRGTLTLEPAPTLTSGWERTGSGGADAYGRAMGVPAR